MKKLFFCFVIAVLCAVSVPAIGASSPVAQVHSVFVDLPERDCDLEAAQFILMLVEDGYSYETAVQVASFYREECLKTLEVPEDPQ